MLGHRTIQEGNYLSSKLSFQSKNYRDGYHKLKLFVLLNSGTGSLADQVGAEAMEIYKTWIVHIDNSPPKAVVVTHIQPEEGRLKIAWQKYEGKEFEYYKIIRSFGPYSTEVCATLTDPNKTTWLDEEYIGGQVSYSVLLKVSSHENGIYGPASPYHYPLPQLLESSYNEAHDLMVRISASPFFNNFEKYELTLNNSIVASITGWKDTLFTVPNPEFGGELHAILRTYSNKAPTNSVPAKSTYATLPALGTPWGPHASESFFCRTSSGFFYAASFDHLKVIDAGTLQVKKERAITNKQIGSVYLNVISQDGVYMYAMLENSIHRLNPLTLQTLETYELEDLLPNGEYYHGAVSGCSNNNRLVVQASTAGTYQSNAYVVDMEQKKVLVIKETPTSTDVKTISPDGKTIRIENQLYMEQPNGSWQQQGIGAYELGKVIFHPTAPLFYTTYGPNIVFYSTANGARQHSLPTEVALKDCEIDPVTGYLYGKADNMLYIYNIETGQLLRKQKLVYNAEVFLHGNRLFSKNRYIAL